jgi:hypothetical protein
VVPDNSAALCDEVKRLPEVPVTTSEDENLVALLSDGEPLGASIVVRSTEAGNRATLA